ncbi:NAD-dependent epimerase/dehydratase family protein [Epidermidibacterium keratini]|uniref:NAD-dependent epimerase/dehydratase family protein n=1 Tax=Epidermidibacterium keratini TaxID=1891644 RepID=A0A7L4YNQ4_9ACTN|nr:D-erythronate dehydrogenase [Epidermidibacterium keratini]QHC00662.1 NAD-dependent epimerase/dehydratase family protein [Epidermidibacterium keratini]
MRIVITGGHGFLGRAVCDELLRRGGLAGQPITEIVLADRAAGTEVPQARSVLGDLHETLPRVFAEPVDAVIHLAAAVSGESEADLDLGLRANVDLTRGVLDAARAQQAAGGPTVRLFFASSVAVYGADAALPLPDAVTEATYPQPQNSYGAEKVVCEGLIADYTRRGLIDGRVARLMTVSVRPGKPNAAASGFLSGIIREPLAGVPAVCPVDPAQRVVISSPRRTVEGIIAMLEAERGTASGQLTGRLPVNLPGLSVTVADMIDGLRRVAGDAVADLVSVQRDPAIEAIVADWPPRFDNTRAAALGLQPDASIDSVIEQYLADHHSQTK